MNTKRRAKEFFFDDLRVEYVLCLCITSFECHERFVLSLTV